MTYCNGGWISVIKYYLDIYNRLTMSKKQTATEWLAEKYNYVTWMRNRDEISAGIADEWRKHYLEVAMRIEREQMIEFAKFADRNLGYGVSFEDLYNQFINQPTPQS